MSSAAPNQTPQIDNALFYESIGWSVVPSHKAIFINGEKGCSCSEGVSCVSKGKHPAVNWTIYQQKRATREQILQWFNGQYKDYGVGIITGAISGIFVIDVDEAPGKSGSETLQNIQMMFGDLPHTVQARTGGGGRHIILKHPGRVTINTAKNVFGPGVDVRGDGGFIVTAPSLHESGRYYLWNESAHPRTTPIADSPEWVIEQAETYASSSGGQKTPPTGSGEIIRDVWGKVIDGRERHMVGIICGVIAEMARKYGCLPEPEVVFAEAWPSYERTTKARGTSLEADNRGETLMRHRIGHMLRRAASGKWKIDTGEREGKTDYDPETGEVYKFPATPLSSIDLDNIPPRQWIYGRELVKRFVSVLASPGGVGKTAYGLCVGVSVALHRSLLSPVIMGKAPLHCHVHESGKVWIYNLEDPLEEMRRRVKAVLKHHGVAKSSVEDRLFIDSGRERPLVVALRARSGDLIAAPVVDLLIAELKRHKITLLIIDPLVQSHSAEENNNEEMNYVMALWGKVANDADCSVWLVHHFRKGGVGGDSDSIRGAVAIQGAARSMFTISVMTKEEAEKFGIPENERWQYIRHDNVKSNMAPPAANAIWYKLVSVPLDNRNELYPEGDLVQTIISWSPPSAWGDMPWEMVDSILLQIDRGLGNGEFYAFGRQSKDRWAGNVIMDIARKSDSQAFIILKTWKEAGVFDERQYASPRQKGSIVSCIRLNQMKFSEMRRSSSTSGSTGE